MTLKKKVLKIYNPLRSVSPQTQKCMTSLLCRVIYLSSLLWCSSYLLWKYCLSRRLSFPKYIVMEIKGT